jgi:hypothetical protein
VDNQTAPRKEPAVEKASEQSAVEQLRQELAELQNQLLQQRSVTNLIPDFQLNCTLIFESFVCLFIIYYLLFI